MKALLFLILYPLAGAVRTEFELVESHISNKKIPLFNIEMDKRKILCIGILIANHQILFRATCMTKFPPKLKGLFARAFSGKRYYPKKLLVRSEFASVEENMDEYAILYLYINPTKHIVRANLLDCAPDGQWSGSVYGRNKDGHDINLYKWFHMGSKGYAVSENVPNTELIIDGVLFYYDHVIGFAKNVHKMKFRNGPEKLYFTVLSTQWTYQALMKNPVVLAKSYTYLIETAETEQREIERGQDDIINVMGKDSAMLFVEPIDSYDEICIGVLTSPLEIFISNACAAKFGYEHLRVSIRYIFMKVKFVSLNPHSLFPEYYVLELEKPLEGHNDFLEIAMNVSPETVSDGAAVGYNENEEYLAENVRFESYCQSYLYSESMGKRSDVIVDGILVRRGQVIGFFERNTLDGNIMTLKIISASPSDGMGYITAPITPLPERESASTSYSYSDEEE